MQHRKIPETLDMNSWNSKNLLRWIDLKKIGELIKELLRFLALFCEDDMWVNSRHSLMCMNALKTRGFDVD